MNEKVFLRFKKNGAPIKELLKFDVLSRSWIARSKIDTDICRVLRSALLEINAKHSLNALKIIGFLPVERSDYNDVRQAITQNDLFFVR